MLHRLRWLLVIGALILVGLRTPVLVNREEKAGSPAALLSSHQPGLDRAGWPVPTSPPVLSSSVASSTSTTALFLPLVLRTANQHTPSLHNPPAARAILAPEQPRTVPVVNAATYHPTVGAEGGGSHPLFLPLVLRPGDAGNVGLFKREATPVSNATSEDANTGAHDQAGTLFLPLVVNHVVQEQASHTSQPATPSQPGLEGTPEAGVSAPTVTPTERAPIRVATVAPTPTPAPAQPNPTLQQLQALLDQIHQLIDSGVLSAAQGQPLIESVTVVMHLPIVIQSHAPPNPTPGQPRPWQRKMQLFNDQVDQLLDSGVLSANQGQVLLDQVQAISQTLGAQ